MTWQPIETAPRDGTHILCHDGFDDDDPIVAVMYWLPALPQKPWTPPEAVCLTRDWGEAGWVLAEAPGFNKHNWPAYWMPLPSSPKATTEAERAAVLEGK